MEKTTRKYVIPWISKSVEVNGKRILEIGCGEGGNLRPFLDKHCSVVALDKSSDRVEQAKSIYVKETEQNKITFLTQDVLHFNLASLGKFDLIILKDFIEHVDQRPFLLNLRTCLNHRGRIFIGFPPWQMPFGGHQQVCNSKFSQLPWIHLFPSFIYLRWLRFIGEPASRIDHLRKTAQTGISIERLGGLLRETGYSILCQQLYLINPGYEAKFNLKPRKRIPLIGSLPYLKNYVNTCCYMLVGVD